jgi:Vacuolar 14 Fab1-binding region
MASLEQLLPPQVLKSLIDRSFDRRKTAALEVEKLLRRLKEGPGGAANGPIIRSVLVTLARDFATGQTPNHRKGGLIALASAAIGLTSATADHLDIIVPAVLVSFSDPEGRVRYYACESLYNIAKVVRGSILRFFPEIFAGVCRLVADSDLEVKNGASLLDRLLKEIVMEGGVVDMERFVPLLRAHMRSPNPYSRQLLVGWVTSLDTLPGVDMLEHLPNLLEGLFEMLSDGNREIRQQAYSALAAFLEQVGRIPHSEFGSRIAFKPMVETLISFTSREKDKFQRLTALEWLLQFILLGRGVLTPVYHRFVAVVLRCLSDPEAEIIAEASRTNSELQALVASSPPPAGNTLVANAVFEGRYNPALPIPSGDGSSSDAAASVGSSAGGAAAAATVTAGGRHDENAPISAFIVAVITTEIRARDRLTRSSALKWTAMMLSLDPTVTLSYAGLLSSLLANLGDSDDPDVMRLNVSQIISFLSTTSCMLAAFSSFVFPLLFISSADRGAG